MFHMEWSTPPPVEQILAHYGVNNSDLAKALIQREEHIAEMIRVSGMLYGLFPEIVAETLAQSTLGEPITDEQRSHIHNNYVALMQRLANENGL